VLLADGRVLVVLPNLAALDALERPTEPQGIEGLDHDWDGRLDSQGRRRGATACKRCGLPWYKRGGPNAKWCVGDSAQQSEYHRA
jgi:hypothetical protein